VIEFAVALLASLLAMSFVEYGIHRWLMHRRTLSWLRQVYERHTFLYHRKYCRVFNHEPDPAGRTININLEVWFGLLIASPLLVTLWWFDYTWLAALFAVIIAIHHRTWSLIHDEMHNQKWRWFRTMWPYTTLQRYHFMHHRYPGKNFNVVLPFWDFVFGTHMWPSPKDEATMKEIGL